MFFFKQASLSLIGFFAVFKSVFAGTCESYEHPNLAGTYKSSTGYAAIFHRLAGNKTNFTPAFASAGKVYLSMKSNGPYHDAQIHLKNDNGGDCYVTAHNEDNGDSTYFFYVHEGANNQCDLILPWGFFHTTVSSYCTQ